MTDHSVRWDDNLRTILRLWPAVNKDIVRIVEWDGKIYNEQEIGNTLSPGKSGRKSKDPRAVRNHVEALQQAGLAYKEGNPPRFVLSQLGKCVFSFLLSKGESCFANTHNIWLLGRLLVRATTICVEQRAILMLMRRVGNRLTNDELSAAMGRIRHLSDVPSVAETILQERYAGTVFLRADRNKMNPQFLLAGGGGVFVELIGEQPERFILPWAEPLIDESLAEETPLVHASTSTDTVMIISEHSSPPVDLSESSFGEATQKRIDEVIDAMNRHGGNGIVALAGVPGTGKSFVALAAAHKYTHPLMVETIQFHQSYTYEDFIEGLRPTLSGGFAPETGVFTRWNDQARKDPNNKYVLLIEEFTRANVTAVLGEVLTYVEHRDRTFTTPLTRRSMAVASNLVILVTMNPRDRSALEIDDALLRRMRIIDCPPDIEQLREMLDKSLNTSIGDVRRDRLISGLSSMFSHCADHPSYNDAMPFGHGIFANLRDEADLRTLYTQRISYLLKRPLIQPNALTEIIEANIIPLFDAP